MSDRRLNWRVPARTARQHPVAATEISYRVAPEFPWTVHVTIPAPIQGDLTEYAQELLFIDVPVGEMFYRNVLIDSVGTRGEDLVISATGAYDGPGIAANFTSTEV